MGLFGKMKKQLLSVIEWKDSSKDIIVYRYPLTDRDEIMNSSTLVVRESQSALFIHKGQICDVFGPGTYKLSTENIPFLTKVLSLPTGFDSPIKAEVYFVNTKQFIAQKWGTQNPIMMRDADFGTVRIRGFGTYSFRVDDPGKFMKEVFGTSAVYRVGDVVEQLRPVLVSTVADAIAETKISALDLAMNYKEISNATKKSAQEEFEKLGLKISNFLIENISLPDEVEKALDERTKMGVLGDKMGTYTQYKTANAIGDAAKNPNGVNFAGIGVGLGATGAMGNMFAGAVNSAKDTDTNLSRNKDAEKQSDKVACVNCGVMINPKAKFCPECGAKQVKVCSNCGKPLTKSAKFCPECGTKVE